MLGCKAGKGHGEIEPQRHIAAAVIGEPVNQFVRLGATLA